MIMETIGGRTTVLTRTTNNKMTGYEMDLSDYQAPKRLIEGKGVEVCWQEENLQTTTMLEMDGS